MNGTETIIAMVPVVACLSVLRNAARRSAGIRKKQQNRLPII